MNINGIFKRNLLTVLSIVAIIAMFLTFTSISIVSEYDFEYDVESKSYTGIQIFEYIEWGYLLIIGPAFLVAMNYIKQIEKYKGMLSIVIPCICLILIVIVFSRAKSVLLAAEGFVSNVTEIFDVGVDCKMSIGIGTILAFVSYVAMIIYGINAHNSFKIGKSGIDLENIKTAGVEFVKNAQSNVTKVTQNISDNINQPATNSKKHIDESLEFIEKLAKMKNDGILTEEEFTEKKKNLLENM